MMKRIFLNLILFLITISAWGGDVARFINLGFSPDGNYFHFGQYGVEQESHKPYGEIFLVDVPKNKFVTAGVQSKIFPKPVSLGDDGMGALLALVEGTIPQRKQRNVDFLERGRLIYIRVMEPKEAAQPISELNFQDFISKETYRVELVQKVQGNDETRKSAFHINLEIHPSTGTKVIKKTIGLPNYFRPGISEYRISQIIKSPDGNSLVFIIEKWSPLDGGSLRFMVETLRL